MTTDRQMAMLYATQQQVIIALTEVGEPDLAGRLERCAAWRRWLAVLLPICRMCMVSSADDPFMVEWYAPLVSRSRDIEPCHHASSQPGLDQRDPADAGDQDRHASLIHPALKD